MASFLDRLRYMRRVAVAGFTVYLVIDRCAVRQVFVCVPYSGRAASAFLRRFFFLHMVELLISKST